MKRVGKKVIVSLLYLFLKKQLKSNQKDNKNDQYFLFLKLQKFYMFQIIIKQS